jgi:hypothetical protein
VLAATLRRNRAALDAHQTLVARVALELQRAGRIAWCGLSLRARIADPQHAQEGDGPLPSLLDPGGGLGAQGQARGLTGHERWTMAMPDVFSVRHTSVAAYLQPEVHEIKVRRADLLGDLRKAHKRAAYLAMAGACWYVLAEGVGHAGDVPDDCGVMLAHGPGFATLEVLRAAPARAMPFDSGLPFALWMALARAAPLPALDEDAQRALGAPPDP